MICVSQPLSRGGVLSSLLYQQISTLMRTYTDGVYSAQQQMLLRIYNRFGAGKLASASSSLLLRAKTGVLSLYRSRNPPFNQQESLRLLNANPRFSSILESTGKTAATGNADQHLLVLDSNPILRSSTAVAENSASENIEGNGVVLSTEKRWRQPSFTVAVDIDEVLGSFLLALNSFIAEEYLCEHKISEFYDYDFKKVWQCSRQEADLRVHSFFKSKHFDSGILPIPGAYKSLIRIASFCDLCVVTSRQNVIRQETIAWIEQHYSGIFKEVHFGNHFALEGEARTKSDICRGVGAQVLIDDNPRYALDCANNGIEVLLFDLHNSYPWSKAAEGLERHSLITRVHSWEEVERILQSKLCIPPS